MFDDGEVLKTDSSVFGHLVSRNQPNYTFRHEPIKGMSARNLVCGFVVLRTCFGGTCGGAGTAAITAGAESADSFGIQDRSSSSRTRTST